MLRQIFLAVNVLVCGSFALPGWAAAPKKRPAKPDPALVTVEKVLRVEVAGEVDRRGQLAETLKEQPGSSPARWQAGFVKDGDGWRSFDEPTRDSATTKLLNEYRLRRDEAPQTFASQLDLADWCRKQGLNDRESAHLRGALALDRERDHSDILVRLGCRCVGGVWLSREDLQDWQRLNQQTEASLKRWNTKLQPIARGLSGSSRQRDVAVTQLRKMDEPSAIPAIELLLAGESEATALGAVDVFKRIDDPAASQALARQAVVSQWPQVRRAAAGALGSRNVDDFVPSLLSVLSTPVQAEVRVFDAGLHKGINPCPGALFYSLILARETVDQFQVVTLTTNNLMADDYLGPHSEIGSIDIRFNGNSIVAIDDQTERRNYARGRTEAVRTMRDQFYIGEQTVEEFNSRVAELNSQIGSALAAITGESATGDAKKWWNWWDQYTDTQQPGGKQLVVYEDTEYLGDPTPKYVSYGNVKVSCFAAGTPVWMELGAQAIEMIKVGDRVLAKDVETGELAYKPVLQVTVRPPKELTTLRFGDETIVCTGGHRFWRSGSGWIKARDLTPQMLLHTVTGNTPVWSAKKGSTAETYNLVVADFHTYFVGKTGMLCQDLLIPKGTNSLVPGLARK